MTMPQAQDFSFKERDHNSVTYESDEFEFIIRHHRTAPSWEAVAYDKHAPRHRNILVGRYGTREEAINASLVAIQEEWTDLHDDQTGQAWVDDLKKAFEDLGFSTSGID